MYKIQEACDNCAKCNFIGYTLTCLEKESEKYNKEVDPAGVCSKYEEGSNWEDLEDEGEV